MQGIPTGNLTIQLPLSVFTFTPCLDLSLKPRTRCAFRFLCCDEVVYAEWMDAFKGLYEGEF